MNLVQFQNKLREVISERFHNEYPDAFVICQTKDQAEYKTANRSKYSFYMKIVNSISKMHEHPDYKIDAYAVEIENSTDREKMIKDCLNAENLILWLFENIEIY